MLDFISIFDYACLKSYFKDICQNPSIDLYNPETGKNIAPEGVMLKDRALTVVSRSSSIFLKSSFGEGDAIEDFSFVPFNT